MIAWLQSLRRRLAAALPWRRCACQGPHHIIEIYPVHLVHISIVLGDGGEELSSCRMHFARTKARCCQCGRVNMGQMMVALENIGGANA